MLARLARVVRHRTFLAALVLILLWGGFTVYESLAAPSRLDPALRQAMTEKPYIQRIAVNLDFTPEDFHINYLQQHGIVAGVQGKRIFLVQVPVNELVRLSELYWVRYIELAN